MRGKYLLKAEVEPLSLVCGNGSFLSREADGLGSDPDIHNRPQRETITKRGPRVIFVKVLDFARGQVVGNNDPPFRELFPILFVLYQIGNLGYNKSDDTKT